MDEQEMDRIDMSHAKYFLLLEKKRFLAPIPENAQRVLDLGTGTGLSPPLITTLDAIALVAHKILIVFIRNMEY